MVILRFSFCIFEFVLYLVILVLVFLQLHLYIYFQSLNSVSSGRGRGGWWWPSGFCTNTKLATLQSQVLRFFVFHFFCAVLCTICISIYNRVYHFALLRKVCTVQILLCAHQQLVTNVLCVMWPNNQVELLALQIIAGTSQMGLDRSYCVLSINPALALLHLNLLTCTCPGDLSISNLVSKQQISASVL